MIAILLALLLTIPRYAESARTTAPVARFTVPQRPVRGPTTCYRAVRNVGRYYRVCIPTARVDSLLLLSPLWRIRDGQYDYLVGPGQTVTAYRHYVNAKRDTFYVDHRKP